MYSYNIPKTSTMNDIDKLNIKNQYKLIRSIKDDKGTINCFSCFNSLYSNEIIYASSNKDIVLYDIEMGSVITRYSNSHERPIHHLRFPTPSLYSSINSGILN